MPIEIRELVIRATAQSESQPEPFATGDVDDFDLDAVVQECVRQVLRILEREKDR